MEIELYWKELGIENYIIQWYTSIINVVCSDSFVQGLVNDLVSVCDSVSERLYVIIVKPS